MAALCYINISKAIDYQYAEYGRGQKLPYVLNKSRGFPVFRKYDKRQKSGSGSKGISEPASLLLVASKFLRLFLIFLGMLL